MTHGHRCRPKYRIRTPRHPRMADDGRPQEARHPLSLHDDVLLRRRAASLRSSCAPSWPSPTTPSSTHHTYNQIFTMHASAMLFLFVIPVWAGFGNYIVPLQIGAADMAFPRINALSFWLVPPAGLIMFCGFLVERRRRRRRLDRLQPARPHGLGTGMDLWIIAVLMLGISSTIGAANFLVTMFRMRAPGMTMFRMPIFCWTVLVTAVLQLLATPGPRLRARHALHRPQLRRWVLRPEQRRQRRPLAERLLVLLAPGGLHHDPAGHGHRLRGPARLLAQAAVRLQGIRLRDHGHRRPRLQRLGPPHVHDRRGAASPTSAS